MGGLTHNSEDREELILFHILTSEQKYASENKCVQSSFIKEIFCLEVFCFLIWMLGAMLFGYMFIAGNFSYDTLE